MSKFYTDSMLGKLTRFLRFFGYDTIYRREQTVKKMLEISKIEERIVLSQSRDIVRLCKKESIRVVKLPTSSIHEQLRILKKEIELLLPYPPKEMRCSICNGTLLLKNKEDLGDRIPPKTSQHYEDFWECKDCKKVYWVGSHWEDIKRIIDEL